ncbi:MAG: hypothetical protein HIU57_07700 [Acidobacteria bacterium]|nr:hypothetical protein [Acidobacteriota bacterium]
MPRSIDAPRERSAPRRYRGRGPTGESIEGEFIGVTLVVAIKDDCLGCRSALEAPTDAFGDVATLFVAARPSTEPWWVATRHLLIVSEELLRDLDVRFPPFYVLIDAARERVLSEGVVFGPEQVRDEVASYLM